jgi:multidrug resistance protein, MATE family
MPDISTPPPPRYAALREELRAMMALAWPLILTNVTQTLVTVTDVIMLGWLGAEPLAASTLGANVYVTVLVIGIGFMLATSPLMASAIGAGRGRIRDVRRTVRQGLWLALLFSVPAWLLLWQAEAILLLLGQDARLAAEAARYMHMLQWALLPVLIQVVLRSFMSALERPGWALVIMSGAVTLNALLNWLLIFGKLGLPALGVVGAGLATTITSVITVLAFIIVIQADRQFRRFHLLGNLWRADWPRLRRMLLLGAPIAGTLGLEVGVFSAAAVLMGLISLSSIAAHAIAIQIASLVFMVPMGLGQAATVRVGLGHGRGDPAAISRAGWTAFALGIGFMVLTASILLLFPAALVSAFIDVSNPANAQVVALAISFLSIAALFQIVDGAQAVGLGMLRGLQDTTWPMVFAAFGYWVVGIGVGAALAFWGGWGGRGIWVGLATGLAIVSVLVLRRWLARERLGLVPHAAQN